MFQDLHNNISYTRVISPVAIGTTGTGKTSSAIDTRGYEGLELVLAYGTITSATAAHTVLLTECADVSGTYTSVADADMLGTEALAGIAPATRVSGTTKNCVKKLGYIGAKRYVKVKVSSTATAGTIISVDGLLHHPRTAPVS
jgi:hypothetical protein